MNQENWIDPLPAWEEKVAAHPDSAADIRTLADAYADRGRWDDAIRAYRSALALNAADADLHNGLGTLYEEAGNPQEAEQAYRQAIRLKPEDALPYYNLGALCQEQARAPEAIRAFEKFLQYSNDSEECAQVRQRLSALMPERQDVVQMYMRIRGWAVAALLLGGLAAASGNVLDPIWGIVMVVVAILSWRIKTPAIFVVYSVPLAWAALMNGVRVFVGVAMYGAAALIGAVDMAWLVLALLQVFWTVLTLRQFRKYRRLPLRELFEAGTWPADLAPPQPEAVVTGRFAIAGIVLAVISLALLPCIIVGSYVLVTAADTGPTPQQMAWLLPGAADVAVLALAFSCAGLLSGNDKKGWAIAGVAVSALELIGWVAMVLVFVLRQG